jgi:catechol 2,3-dioxygenase-like lactoylglutathione lyase family enzyme
MSTPLLGLRTVIYPTSTLDETKKWWAELLGFAPYFDEPFYVGFNVGGYELGLLPDGDTSKGARTYWGVDDVQSAVVDALEAGATIESAPEDVGDGITTAMVTTPDGSLLGFIHNPHFSTT